MDSANRERRAEIHRTWSQVVLTLLVATNAYYGVIELTLKATTTWARVNKAVSPSLISIIVIFLFTIVPLVSLSLCQQFYVKELGARRLCRGAVFILTILWIPVFFRIVYACQENRFAAFFSLFIGIVVGQRLVSVRLSTSQVSER